MVRYELIKQQQDFNNLVKSGIIPTSIYTWLQVYETYLGETKSNEKTIAIQFTADYYNLTIQTIYRVISFMET